MSEFGHERPNVALSGEPIPVELQQRALESAQLMMRAFAGTILHWTHGMERLYGWQRQEAVGRNSHELLQTIFPRRLVDIEAELVDKGEWAGELIRRRRDGERVVAASHWSLWDKAGYGAQRVVELDNYLTPERREYEAGQYLANIVDSAHDAIIGKTLDGIITSWNKAAELIFGYTAEEVIGKSITMLFPPDRINEEIAFIDKIKHGERVDHYETFRRRKDGGTIPVSLTISPIVGSDGRIIGASKIVRDISERHQAQAKLQEVQSALYHISRLNTVSHMVSGLAHELNQPLSAISNYLRAAQILLGERTDNASIGLRNAIAKASGQTERVAEVVKRLRKFLSRGEIEFKFESLSQLVKETSELALPGVNDAEVLIQLDASLDSVLIDRIQVQQVLLNLIRNAFEAMEDSERRDLRIVSAASECEMVEVSVIDAGPGIAENVAAQLFQPFVTTKRHGMGVGLSISKTIIEAHGGQIWVEPNPSGGTIFRFTLPLVPGMDE